MWLFAVASYNHCLFIRILQARELGVTPMQLAEYVFWTGDERGVSLAIQEFLQQGLVSWISKHRSLHQR